MSKSIKAVLIKSVATVTGLLLISYLSACGFLFWRQNQLIYKPTTQVQKPSLKELGYQEVWLSIPAIANQKQIYGWWIPTSSQEKRVVLYFHGAGQNLGSYQGDLKSLHGMGFSVLAIDYRGYGMSKGSFPSEAQIYEDAQSAWNYLIQDRHIPPSQIYLFGVSLGGAIAIDLASHHPDAAALIVVSSFTSMRDEVENLGYWMFPIDLILTQRFESLSKISSVKMPLLLAHGTSDDYVPTWMSRKLYDAASKPKRLLLFPGIDHGRIGVLIGTDEFKAALQQLHKQVSKSN